jgi:hypothetical protein
MLHSLAWSISQARSSGSPSRAPPFYSHAVKVLSLPSSHVLDTGKGTTPPRIPRYSRKTRFPGELLKHDNTNDCDLRAEIVSENTANTAHSAAGGGGVRGITRLAHGRITARLDGVEPAHRMPTSRSRRWASSRKAVHSAGISSGARSKSLTTQRNRTMIHRNLALLFRNKELPWINNWPKPFPGN